MKRIQRQRTKGWRMPPNTVYVGRPSVWGNPWTIKNLADETWGLAPSERAAAAVRMYRKELTHWGLLSDYATFVSEPAHDRVWRDVQNTKARNMAEYAAVALKGKDLACWCPLDQPCHADVLLELAA